MSRYFTFTVEGECPDDVDKSELRETLNDELPGWADGYVTRLDDPPEEQ